MSRKGIFLGNFLFCPNLNYQTFYCLSLLTGLLISAPGTRFPRGAPGASSTLLAPAGSPVTSISRRSRVPSAPINKDAIRPKGLQHTKNKKIPYNHHIKKKRDQMGGYCPHYKKDEFFQEETRIQYICQSSEEGGYLEPIHQ